MLEDEYLDNGFQNSAGIGPGNQVFFGTAPNTIDYFPDKMYHGSYSTTTETLTVSHTITPEKWAELGLTDPNMPHIPFKGLYGIGFSPDPSNVDPGTNHGYMVGTSNYGFWQVGLQGTSAAYNPVAGNTKLLCSLLGRKYPGGMGFIPSGSKKHSVMLADYYSSTVQILPLDYTTVQDGTTGLCIDSTTGQAKLGTVNPQLQSFATGIDGAWGFLFDPQVRESIFLLHETIYDVNHRKKKKKIISTALNNAEFDCICRMQRKKKQIFFSSLCLCMCISFFRLQVLLFYLTNVFNNTTDE